jgi:hypothetical protein
MGYKKHPILYTNFKYLDVDVAGQQAATGGSPLGDAFKR